MAGAIVLVRYYFGQDAENTKRAAAVLVAIGVVSGGVVFLAAAAGMRASELQELWGAVRGKARRDNNLEETV